MTSRPRADAFVCRGRAVALDGPALMGVVNASPESFSGDASTTDVSAQVALARQHVEHGALIVDVGGQSANTVTPEIPPDEEIRRVVPVIDALRDQGVDALVSVDTYQPSVAEACFAAGADIINDVSGIVHDEMVDVVARWGGGYVLTHTEGRPKEKVLDPGRYRDVTDDVIAFLGDRLSVLAARGVSPEQVLLDPGIDFGKTPRQSLELLNRIDELGTLGRPLLVALSRKDFIGHVTSTRPRDRDPGTLAAVVTCAIASPLTVFRVHDVRAAHQGLAVLAAIRDPALVPREAVLAEHLRREPTS